MVKICEHNKFVTLPKTRFRNENHKSKHIPQLVFLRDLQRSNYTQPK